MIPREQRWAETGRYNEALVKAGVLLAAMHLEAHKSKSTVSMLVVLMLGSSNFLMAGTAAGQENGTKPKTFDMKVFGISLGQSVTLPTCPRSFDSDSLKETCLLRDQIMVPAGKLPDWAGASYLFQQLSVTVQDSVLVAIKIHQIFKSDAMYTALRDKYGPPSRVRRKIFTNDFGTESKTEDWEWIFPGLHVEFTLRPDQRSLPATEGSLIFEVGSLYQSRTAKNRSEKEGRLKL